MDTLRKLLGTLIASFLFLFAIIINLNAQTAYRSIHITEINSSNVALNNLSGIWHSSQMDVEKIVLTDLHAGSLLCKWYFKSGNITKYVLKKVRASNGKNARVVEKSIDLQSSENETNGIYEYTYGEKNRYIGTLFIYNGTIVEIDEDTQNPDYYARYEWSK